MNPAKTAQVQDAYSRVSRSLPVLRGWAIVWIVAYHLMGNTQGYLDLEEAIASFGEGSVKNIIESILDLFLTAGSTGVNVFLIISGFGLTASWWKRYGAQGKAKIPLTTFWKRRVLRIMPSFWAAVAIALLLYFINPAYAPFGQILWSQGNLSPLFAILTTLSTLRNFIPDHYYFLNGAWWYVGLSIQLYLIFPWLVQFGCRVGWFKLLSASLLFSLTYRAIFLLSPIGGGSDIIPLAFFPSRIFEFVFGMYLAIALLQPSNQSQTTRLSKWLNNLLFKLQFAPISLCLFLAGLSFKWLPYPALNIFSEALIGVGLFSSLVNFSQLEFLRKEKISQFVGKYSYGIYLTHMNVYLVLWPIAAWVPSYWVRFSLVAIASCLIGIMLELCFTICSRSVGSKLIANRLGNR